MQQVLSKRFIGYCRVARAAILLVLAGLALIVGGIYFIGPIILGAGGSASGLFAYLLGSLAIWHHTLLFMAALWFLQRAAGSLTRGDAEPHPLQRRLTLAGWFLIAGSMAWALTRPLLLNSAWFAQHLVNQDLEYPVWSASHVDNFVAAAVIGLVGLLLVLISNVLRNQAAEAAELRQIF